MYLLDTNVVSELRKNRPHGGVLTWLKEAPAGGIFLSAVTIGEIQAGVERARQQDADKAAQIEIWLDELVNTSQVLPMDSAIFRLWAKLMVGVPDQQQADAMIAATATVHRLTVVTRNTRDFRVFKVHVFNPFNHQ